MIVVQNVSKYYGGHPAVRDLDFEIADGECVGFLGLNGAGKTTTLRLLSCLLLPTSGRIHIRGLDVEQAPHEIRKFIGFLPDTPPLYPEMTVTDFLRFAGRLRRMDKGAVRRRLPDVFDVCGLNEVAELPINTLSLGYRQRVGIAQAIVHEPDLLILDEPIQGLDPVQIVEMREMIRELRGKHTILLSTHILSEIQQTCDRILILNDGQIAAEGSEEELLGRQGAAGVVEAEIRWAASSELATVRAAVCDLFSDVAEVGEVQVDALADGAFSVHVTAENDARELVASKLVGGGAGLLRLDRQASGLEAMFVELSGSGGANKTRGEGA